MPRLRRRTLVCCALVVAVLTTLAVGGELPPGGKLLPLMAVLNSGQEAPPIDSSMAFGVAYATLNLSTGVLTYSITYTDLPSGATLAHIHGPAAPGVSTGVLLNLSPGGPPTNPLNGASAPLEKDVIKAIKKGLTYINIHSGDHGGGEIRGQLMPQKPTYKL